MKRTFGIVVLSVLVVIGIVLIFCVNRNKKNENAFIDDKSEQSNDIKTTVYLDCCRGIISNGTFIANNRDYVSTKYYYASKGSIIKIQPKNFNVSNLIIYFYSDVSEMKYNDCEKIHEVSIGDSGVYSFDKDTYFRIRASKPNATELTDEEVYQFNKIFIFETYNTISDFVPTFNENNSSKVENDSSLVDSQKEVFIPKEWRKRVEEVNNLAKDNYVFGIQTDTHLSIREVIRGDGTIFHEMQEDDITPFKEITNSIKFDFIANLGDLIRGYGFDTFDDMKKSFTEIVERYTDGVSCPVLFTIGNHDDAAMWTTNPDYGGSYTLEEVICPSELYSILIQQSINTSNGKITTNNQLYYYMDLKDIRVIVLNTRDLDFIELSKKDVYINHHKISEEQLTWLSEEALNTNKPIIILCHVPLVRELVDDSDYDINFEGFKETVLTIENYKNNGGTVIGVFCGHIHKQKNVVINGINHISFANGARFAEIVIVDLKDRLIKTRMIGNYGNRLDREFSY